MEDQAAISDCHIASSSLDHPDSHGQLVILKMPPIAFWLAFRLVSCDMSLKNSNNACGVVNQGRGGGGGCLFKLITKKDPHSIILARGRFPLYNTTNK